jgi:hypothetical protein
MVALDSFPVATTNRPIKHTKPRELKFSYTYLASPALFGKRAANSAKVKVLKAALVPERMNERRGYNPADWTTLPSSIHLSPNYHAPSVEGQKWQQEAAAQRLVGLAFHTARLAQSNEYPASLKRASL